MKRGPIKCAFFRLKVSDFYPRSERPRLPELPWMGTEYLSQPLLTPLHFLITMACFLTDEGGADLKAILMHITPNVHGLLFAYTMPTMRPWIRSRNQRYLLYVMRYKVSSPVRSLQAELGSVWHNLLDPPLDCPAVCLGAAAIHIKETHSAIPFLRLRSCLT